MNKIREDMLKVKRMVSEVEMILGKREGETELVNKLIDAENLLTYCMSRLENAIVPPCKVGDKVFVVSQGQGFCMCWNVYEGKVVDIHLNRHNKLTIRVENGEKFFGYYEPCFVFLTREEAEKALTERQIP